LGLFDIFRKKAVATPAAMVQREDKQDDKEELPTPVLSIKIMSSSEDEIVPAEERIKEAIASIHGLYPHEVLVLHCAPSFYTNDNDPDGFQGFWWYRYGVRDVPAVLSSLLERGFLQIGDLKGAIEAENMTTLKNILKDRDLKTGGKKAELVQRLLAEVSQDELDVQFPKRKYQLTPLGCEALDKESYIPYIHGRSIEDLDIWSLNKLVHAEPYMPYRDKIWGYLNQRSVRHAMDGQYGLYCNCKYTMASFLMQEDRLKEALAMLVEVAFYNLADTYYDLKEIDDAIAPGIIDDMVYCQQELGYSRDELKAVLQELTNGLSVPRQRLPSGRCINIISKAIEKFIVEDKERENIFEKKGEEGEKLLEQRMLDFLAANQPILQKDFLDSFRAATPNMWDSVPGGIGYTLDGVFHNLLNEGKIRREKAGRSFSLFVA
jgi:hypothetical protein